MPPICVVGLGLAHGNWSLSLGAGLLYLTNLLGITLSCMLMFLAAGYMPFRRAQRALSLAIAFTGILFLPLSICFIELVRQNRLESSLRTALLNRTITFQRLDLVNFNTDWLSQPPQVNLTVRAKAPITPKQVKLLESFLEREMGQKFTLVFLVSQVEKVTQSSGTASSSSSPTVVNQ